MVLPPSKFVADWLAEEAEHERHVQAAPDLPSARRWRRQAEQPESCPLCIPDRLGCADCEPFLCQVLAEARAALDDFVKLATGPSS